MDVNRRAFQSSPSTQRLISRAMKSMRCQPSGFVHAQQKTRPKLALYNSCNRAVSLASFLFETSHMNNRPRRGRALNPNTLQLSSSKMDAITILAVSRHWSSSDAISWIPVVVLSGGHAQSFPPQPRRATRWIRTTPPPLARGVTRNIAWSGGASATRSRSLRSTTCRSPTTTSQKRYEIRCS